MVDVVTFNDLGIFVSNQTGNVIFLSMGALGIQNEFYDPIRSIVALSAFCFGSFITGRLALQFGAKNRIYLLSTFVVQALVLLIFAILILTQTISLDPIDSHFQLLIVFPLAIVFGAQVAISRPFGLPAIPTAVVTAAFVDLFCDPKLFISPLSSNVPRNHRIIFIITFFLGGIVGAGIIKTVGWGYVLIVAGIIKLVVAGSILFLDGAKEINEEGEKSVGKAKELKEDEDDFHSPTKRTNEGVIGSTRPLTEIMFADGELTRINSRVSMESIKTIVV